jgi:predicted RNA-binding protein with PIN domain
MYVIDGHNLIPKIPGMSLRQIDDEEKLISLLQVYARVRRRGDIQVFFDGAPPGRAGERNVGGIRAHFVSSGKTADQAIRQYLDFLGRRAHNVTVVTSDRTVQANARECHARVQSSEAFADELMEAREQEPERIAARERAAAKESKEKGRRPQPPPEPPKPAPDAHLKEWYDMFGIDPSTAAKPIEPPETNFRYKGKKRK